MTPATIWRKAPAERHLPQDEIHLWRASIQELLPQAQVADLSEQERIKLGALKNETVRAQFFVSHWLTRQILASYLQLAPSELQFNQSKAGKPNLIGTPLEFNRSHSGGWLVLALSTKAVGVDIEKVGLRSQMDAIVERWFEEPEKEEFRRLSDAEKPAFFHSRWTQKEAVLKAWGVGLVQLSDYAKFQRASWSCRFEPAPGLAGCVAQVDLTPRQLQFYRA
ncbi:MAG: 4'-phosphopantetheinyl transferase superfamily protein [Chthoniobacterales bacterium]